jgi:hypothetical protein
VKHILILACLGLLVSGSALANSAPLPCNASQGVPKAGLLMLGEMHGSKESPELTGRIVCAAALAGPVVLGLEIPASEQAAIDRFLASGGGESAKAQLLSGDFWQTDKDGRTSAAMFALIEYVRRLKQRDLPLSILAFARAGGHRGITRDAALADSIRRYRTKHPKTRMIVLTGNVHASQAQVFKLGTSQIIPAAYLLRDLHPVSVLIAYPFGSIRACMPGCGVHQVGSKQAAHVNPGFYNEASMPGYSVSYMLPSITASPPAVDGEHR